MGGQVTGRPAGSPGPAARSPGPVARRGGWRHGPSDDARARNGPAPGVVSTPGADLPTATVRGQIRPPVSRVRGPCA